MKQRRAHDEKHRTERTAAAVGAGAIGRDPTAMYEKQMPSLQESIAAWFKNRFSFKADVVLEELKSFIVGCYKSANHRVALFKYFFTRDERLDSEAPDRTRTFRHFDALMGKLEPSLAIKSFINRAEKAHGDCYVQKTTFVNALRHAVAHVPPTAASYQVRRVPRARSKAAPPRLPP
jgi:hypothetical protein